MGDMTKDSWDDFTVAEGLWTYDGTADESVKIVGLPYDWHYALAEQDEQLEPGEQPNPMGPEGLLYYVVFAEIGGPSFPTALQAKGYAQSQVQSEIRRR